MEEVFDAFFWLLTDTSGHIQNDELANFLLEYRDRRVVPMKNRAKTLEIQNYVISFFGLTNVGKSSLAEALLEASVAPISNGPATSFPLEYRYADSWKLILYSSPPMSYQFDCVNDLSLYLKEHFSRYSEDKAAKTTKAVVQGPMPLLKDGLILIDTPGIGAASVSGDDNEKVASRLLHFLVKNNINDVFFCVSSENWQVSNEERQFFEEIRDRCRAVLITKWGEEDETDADERNYKSRYQLVFHPSPLMFVGASKGYHVEKLKNLIRQYSTVSYRRDELKNQLKDCWEEINELSREFVMSIDWWPVHFLENFLIEARNNGILLKE